MLCSDYIENNRLDAYDAGDLNDSDEFSDDPLARQAAEARMSKRDQRSARNQVGAEGRKKNRRPQFLDDDGAEGGDDSEDEEQLMGRNVGRRIYDERINDDGEIEVVSSRLALNPDASSTQECLLLLGNAHRTTFGYSCRFYRSLD